MKHYLNAMLLCCFVCSFHSMRGSDDTVASIYSEEELKLALGEKWDEVRKTIKRSRKEQLIQEEKRLLKAAKKYEWATVQTIIEKNPTIDVNVCDDESRSPLLCATEDNALKIAKLLLDRGAKVNQKYHARRPGIGLMKCFEAYNIWQGGKTPIFGAIREQNIDMVKLLLNHKADVNETNDLGTSSLSLALDQEIYTDETGKLVAMLCLAGAEVNAQEKIFTIINYQYPKDSPYHIKKYGGQTPLMKAAQRKDVDMVTFLLATGACNINAKDAFGKTAIDYAREVQSDKIVALLQQAVCKDFPEPSKRQLSDFGMW